MATRSSIFPSLNEDRVYFAEDFLARPDRDHLAGEGDGVSREVGNSLEVTETDPASLAVDVDTGACRGDGWRFEVHTDKETVELDDADPSDDRIDRIIVRIRLGSANRDAIVTNLTGTPAGSPSAPALTRSGDTYEISLAQVLVGAGETSVTDADITDERGDTDVCGWLRAQDSELLDGKTEAEIISDNVTGKQPIFINAAAMHPQTTAGCDPFTRTELTAGQPEVGALTFADASTLGAQFDVRMPEAWDEGPVTCIPDWTTADTGTGVVRWVFDAVAQNDGDDIDAAFGSGIAVEDAAQSGAHKRLAGAESSAITIAGTPAAGAWVTFRIRRGGSHANDTLSADALLRGVTIYITTDAATDD